jgi:hypothetical protein
MVWQNDLSIDAIHEINEASKRVEPLAAAISALPTQEKMFLVSYAKRCGEINHNGNYMDGIVSPKRRPGPRRQSDQIVDNVLNTLTQFKIVTQSGWTLSGHDYFRLRSGRDSLAELNTALKRIVENDT